MARYAVGKAGPELLREAELHFFDDKAGKPVGIHKFIGRRPIAAFGNSDGDFEMLDYVTSGSGARLGVEQHQCRRGDAPKPGGIYARGVARGSTGSERDLRGMPLRRHHVFARRVRFLWHVQQGGTRASCGKQLGLRRARTLT